MATNGPNLGIFVSEVPGTTPWNTAFEAGQAKLDAIVMLDVISRSLNTPPGSPTAGDRYHTGGSPTGLWSGQSNKIAVWNGTAWVFYTPLTGWLMTSQADAGRLYKFQSSAFVLLGFLETIIIAASDETTAITTGTGKVAFRMPFAMTLTSVRASLTTAQASGSIFTINVKESGTTIFSTKPTIDNTEKTTTTAATPSVLSDTSLADDAEITVDVDQVGTSGATGLKVYLIGART